MQRLKTEVRQKIIEVGKNRFQKDGYENTSMKEIAMYSGISIGNIYRYFLTKKHILNEILGEIEAEIKTFFEQLPSNYEAINMHNLFEMVSDLTVKIAEENKGKNLKYSILTMGCQLNENDSEKINKHKMQSLLLQ